jgi:hypothetical protein
LLSVITERKKEKGKQSHHPLNCPQNLGSSKPAARRTTQSDEDFSQHNRYIKKVILAIHSWVAPPQTREATKLNTNKRNQTTTSTSTESKGNKIKIRAAGHPRKQQQQQPDFLFFFGVVPLIQGATTYVAC